MGTKIGSCTKTVMTTIQDMISEGQQNETGFIGKVVSVAEDLQTCTVQPLRQFENGDGDPEDYAIIEDVPITDQAKWRAKPYVAPKLYDMPCGSGDINEIKYSDEAGNDPDTDHWQNTGHVYWEKIKAGDLCVCLCCGKGIDAAVDGEMEIEGGEPSINNAIVIGTLQFKDAQPVYG